MALVVYLAIEGQAAGQPIYVFTTLNVPGSSFPSPANSINDSGQTVGNYNDADGHEHGFLLDNGTYTTRGVPLAVAVEESIGVRSHELAAIFRITRHASRFGSGSALIRSFARSRSGLIATRKNRVRRSFASQDKNG
jgi:hypothetical protein